MSSKKNLDRNSRAQVRIIQIYSSSLYINRYFFLWIIMLILMLIGKKRSEFYEIGDFDSLTAGIMKLKVESKDVDLRSCVNEFIIIL